MAKPKDDMTSSATRGLNKTEKLNRDFIDMAFKVQEEGTWISTAERLLDFFKGKYYKSPESKERFVVNSIFSLVMLLIPNLAFQEPYIRCKPKNGRSFKKLADGEYRQINAIRAAQIREAAINYEYKYVGAMNEQRKALQDSLFYSFGITKTGHSFETISEEDTDYILKDSNYLKRVCPRDFGWHPLATSLSDSPKLVHRIVTTKSKLKKVDRFSKKVDDLEEELPKYLMDKIKNKQDFVKDYGYIPVYEVHDLDADKIFTYAGGQRKLIDKIDNPYKYTGAHFDMIRFASDNDEFLGIPFLAMIEDFAIELNEVMTLIIEHTRKFPGLVILQKGAEDEDEIEKMKTGEQGSIHSLNEPGKVVFTPPLAMGSEYLNLINLLMSMMDRILGIPDFQRMGSTTRKSATEASFIQGDATVRRKYFLTIVKEFMLSGIGKLDKLQQQYQDDKVEVQASGMTDANTFTFDKSDIQGDWLFDFDIDTLAAINQDQANNLISALNVVGAHDAFKPLVMTMSPEKTGRELFKLLGLDIDKFKDASIENNVVFVDPLKEDKMARSGIPMPNPKVGEDHQQHIEVHKKDLDENGWNEQIGQHIASHTILLMQEKGMGQQPGIPPGQPGSPPQPLEAQQPGMPPGPTGPMQQPNTGSPTTSLQ